MTSPDGLRGEGPIEHSLNRAAFEFTGRQLELYEELNRRQRQAGNNGADLSWMYHGALITIAQADNPDRLALAAHGLRELIEKLPRILGAPVMEKPTPLRDRVGAFRQVFLDRAAKSRCRNGDEWTGAIDPPLADILAAADRLAHEFIEDHPARSTQAARTLRALARGAEPLPETYEEQVARTLLDLERFFQAVSHHGKEPSGEEMDAQLELLTDLLLDYMRPRTVGAMKQLDEIILEAESASHG